MDSAYILELIFIDEDGKYRSKYSEHDMYALVGAPTFRCLMELTSAKAKRTKILKYYKRRGFKNLVDIKIREVNLSIGKEIIND